VDDEKTGTKSDSLDEQVDPHLDRVRRVAEEMGAAADAFSSSAVDQYLIQADTRPDAPDIQCVVSFYFDSTFLCSTVMASGRVTQLQPVLACKWLYVIWDTATQGLVQLQAFEAKDVQTPS
jgi:hypothetical protein